ncbi:unnamed protein product, partial [Meganyctiphanes norvegica]
KHTTKNNECCGIQSFSNSSMEDTIKNENLHFDGKITDSNINKCNSSPLMKKSDISGPLPIEKQNDTYSGIKSLTSIPTTKQIQPTTQNGLFTNISEENHRTITVSNSKRNSQQEFSTITTSVNSSVSNISSQTNNSNDFIRPDQSRNKKVVENTHKKDLKNAKEKESPEVKNTINITPSEKNNDPSISFSSQPEMCSLVSVPKVQTCLEGSSNILSLSHPQFSLSAGSLGMKLISPAVTFPGVINALTLPCYSSSITYPQFSYVYSGSNTGLFHPSASFIPSYSGCLPTQGIPTANLLSEIPSDGGTLPIIPLISPINSQGSIITSTASSLGSILTPAPFQNPIISTSTSSSGLTLTSVTASSSSIQPSTKIPLSTSSAPSLGLSATSSAPVITSFSGPLTVPTSSTLGSSLPASKHSSNKTQTSSLSALKADTTSNQVLSATANVSNVRLNKEDSSARKSDTFSSLCPKNTLDNKLSESSVKGTIPKSTTVIEKESSPSTHMLLSVAKVPETEKHQNKEKNNLNNESTFSDKKASFQSSASSMEIVQNKSFKKHPPKLEVQSDKKGIKEDKTIASHVTIPQSSLLLKAKHHSPSPNTSVVSPSIKPQIVSTQPQNTAPFDSSQNYNLGNSVSTQRSHVPSSGGNSKDMSVSSQQNKHEMLTSFSNGTKTSYDGKLCNSINLEPTMTSEQIRKFSHANTLTNWQCDAKQSTQVANFMQGNQPMSCIGPSLTPGENSVQGHFSKFHNFFNSPFTVPSYNASPLHSSLEAISQLLENENIMKTDKNKLPFSPSITSDIFNMDKNALQIGTPQPESCQLPSTFMPFGTHSLEKTNTSARDSLGRQMLQKLPNMSESPFPGNPFPIQVPNVSTASMTLNSSQHSIPTRSDYCQVSTGNKVFDALNVFGASPMFSVPVKSSDTNTSHASYTSKTFSQSAIDAKAFNKESHLERLKNYSEVGDESKNKVCSEFSEPKVSNFSNQLLTPNNMSTSGLQGECKTQECKDLQNYKKHWQMNNSEQYVNKESTTKSVEKDKSDFKLVPSKACLPSNTSVKDHSNA